MQQSREDDEAARQRRQEVRRKRQKDAEWMRGIAMAGLKEIVRRDAETGELALSRELTPREIRELYELADRVDSAAEAEALAAGEQASPSRYSEAEVERRLAKYRPVFERLARQQSQEREGADNDSSAER